MAQAARLLVIIVIIQSCYTGESSPRHRRQVIHIDVNYTRPVTFDRFKHFPEDTHFRAGTRLTLTCRAPGVERAFYHWTSTCSNCFANRISDDGAITAEYLRSIDSGVHTCTVHGSKEEMGSASVTVEVVGAGIYDASKGVGLPNNGLIVGEKNRENLDFKCLSGSGDLGVGDVFDINKDDITESSADAFFSFQRKVGAIHVQSSRGLHSDNETGIYSCVIPDETRTNRTVYVGLYSNEEDVTLSFLKMEMNVIRNGEYALTCTTTGSPPTIVTWIRDDNVLPISENEGMYTSYQQVIDRPSSTYDNVLEIKGAAGGVYRCNITNRLHYASRELTVHELEVRGNETTLIVGMKRVLRCTAYFNVSNMMWYRTGDMTVLTRSAAPSYEVDLELAPESIALNNEKITCKAETVSGRLVRREVTIKVRDFIHNVTITGPSAPWLTDNENPYTLTCVAYADIRQEVRWVDADGHPVVEDDALSISGPELDASGKYTTLNLTFTKPNASHAGMYKCLSVAPERMPPSQNSSHWDVIIKPQLLASQSALNPQVTTGGKFGTCPPQQTRDLAIQNLSQSVLNIITGSSSSHHCGAGQWTQVAFFNMSDSSQQCPASWRLVSGNGIRACGRPSGTNNDCYSQTYTVQRRYNKVCGQVISYQVGSTDAFARLNSDLIDEAYVDGVSITYGTPRNHIWTFSSGITETTNLPDYSCPCSSPGAPQPPSFVGNNYFCESGNSASSFTNGFQYTDDLLWDGKMCEGQCCSNANSPPWFSIELPAETSDNIEIRICGGEGTSNEDTPIRLLDIYIQ